MLSQLLSMPLFLLISGVILLVAGVYRVSKIWKANIQKEQKILKLKLTEQNLKSEQKAIKQSLEFNQDVLKYLRDANVKLQNLKDFLHKKIQTEKQTAQEEENIEQAFNSYSLFHKQHQRKIFTIKKEIGTDGSDGGEGGFGTVNEIALPEELKQARERIAEKNANWYNYRKKLYAEGHEHEEHEPHEAEEFEGEEPEEHEGHEHAHEHAEHGEHAEHSEHAHAHVPHEHAEHAEHAHAHAPHEHAEHGKHAHTHAPHEHAEHGEHAHTHAPHEHAEHGEHAEHAEHAHAHAPHEHAEHTEHEKHEHAHAPHEHAEHAEHEHTEHTEHAPKPKVKPKPIQAQKAVQSPKSVIVAKPKAKTAAKPKSAAKPKQKLSRTLSNFVDYALLSFGALFALMTFQGASLALVLSAPFMSAGAIFAGIVTLFQNKKDNKLLSEYQSVYKNCVTENQKVDVLKDQEKHMNNLINDEHENNTALKNAIKETLTHPDLKKYQADFEEHPALQPIAVPTLKLGM